MKKVFVLFAVAAMIVACNKPAQQNEEAVETVETEVVAVDSAAAPTVEVVDSAVVVETPAQ